MIRGAMHHAPATRRTCYAIRGSAGSCGAGQAIAGGRDVAAQDIAELAAQGHLTSGGKPYVASAVQAMLARHP